MDFCWAVTALFYYKLLLWARDGKFSMRYHRRVDNTYSSIYMEMLTLA